MKTSAESWFFSWSEKIGRWKKFNFGRALTNLAYPMSWNVPFVAAPPELAVITVSSLIPAFCIAPEAFSCSLLGGGSLRSRLEGREFKEPSEKLQLPWNICHASSSSRRPLVTSQNRSQCRVDSFSIGTSTHFGELKFFFFSVLSNFFESLPNSAAAHPTD